MVLWPVLLPLFAFERWSTSSTLFEIDLSLELCEAKNNLSIQGSNASSFVFQTISALCKTLHFIKISLSIWMHKKDLFKASKFISFWWVKQKLWPFFQINVEKALMPLFSNFVRWKLWENNWLFQNWNKKYTSHIKISGKIFSGSSPTNGCQYMAGGHPWLITLDMRPTCCPPIESKWED